MRSIHPKANTVRTWVGGRRSTANPRPFRPAADLLVYSELSRFEKNCVLARGCHAPVPIHRCQVWILAGAFLQMLGVFAEFKTAIRRERQLEGIAKSKADGFYKGRKPSIDAQAVRALAAE